MIDQFSISVMTTVVVMISGVLFIVETLLRRDEAVGRLWSLGYLFAILTTLLYLAWAWDPASWWAVAGGNATFVAASGFMWLGCRRFNGGSMPIASGIVAVVSIAVLVAALLEGPDGGDWAGALWMFVALAGFGVVASYECLTGELARMRTAAALAFVFGVQGLYYSVRSVVFVAVGPDAPLFENWFGSITTAFLTNTLMITAVVATSVLRATRASVRGGARSDGEKPDWFAIQSQDAFRASLATLCARAKVRRDLVCLTVVRLEDLDYISTAFGADTRDDLIVAWRSALADAAPSLSIIGEDDVNALAVATLVGVPTDARRQGMAIYRSLFDALNEVTGGVLPAVGVGVALSDSVDYDAAELLALARATSVRAASSIASAVLVADPP